MTADSFAFALFLAAVIFSIVGVWYCDARYHHASQLYELARQRVERAIELEALAQDYQYDAHSTMMLVENIFLVDEPLDPTDGFEWDEDMSQEPPVPQGYSADELDRDNPYFRVESGETASPSNVVPFSPAIPSWLAGAWKQDPTALVLA